MIRRSLFVYALAVFALFILVSLAVYSFTQLAEYRANADRRERIMAIYSSLNLDDGYRTAEANIFGDKRPYSWDKTASFASSVSYGRNAGASDTFADLKKRIEAAGFTEIERPNDGTTAPTRQDRYKNDRGEYLRVSVSPKAWHDAILYGVAPPAPRSPEMTEIGPVYVTISVNLDDNNE